MYRKKNIKDIEEKIEKVNKKIEVIWISQLRSRI